MVYLKKLPQYSKYGKATNSIKSFLPLPNSAYIEALIANHFGYHIIFHISRTLLLIKPLKRNRTGNNPVHFSDPKKPLLDNNKFNKIRSFASYRNIY